jgi:hypothetical protein
MARGAKKLPSELATKSGSESDLLDQKVTRAMKSVRVWRLLLAGGVDVLHLCIGGFLLFGWLEPAAWRTHVLTVTATLAGWAGFGACPISSLSSALRKRRSPRFDHFNSVRTWFFAKFGNKPQKSECDLAGVVMLCVSVMLSLARAGVPEARYFLCLSLFGLVLSKACGYKALPLVWAPRV